MAPGFFNISLRENSCMALTVVRSLVEPTFQCGYDGIRCGDGFMMDLERSELRSQLG